MEILDEFLAQGAMGFVYQIVDADEVIHRLEDVVNPNRVFLGRNDPVSVNPAYLRLA